MEAETPPQCSQTRDCSSPPVPGSKPEPDEVALMAMDTNAAMKNKNVFQREAIN